MKAKIKNNSNFKKSYDVKLDAMPYGVITGYASTWDIDQEGDCIQRGAFVKSLQDWRNGGKQIPMCYNHDFKNVIGGFDPAKMYEDSKGLVVTGNINQEVQAGRELYALAKQGVVNSMSVQGKMGGAMYDTKGIRLIKEVKLYEISITPIPANENAEILEVKTCTGFKDYQLADEDTAWDADSAIKRIRDFTGSKEEPSKIYKNFFMWYDTDKADSFGGYKFPYVDIVGGKPKVIPKAISAILGAIGGARGGANIPDEDIAKIRSHCEKYKQKMDNTEKTYKINTIDIDCKGLNCEEIAKRKQMLEKALIATGCVSRKAANVIVAKVYGSIKPQEQILDTQISQDYTVIKQISDELKKCETILDMNSLRYELDNLRKLL